MSHRLLLCLLVLAPASARADAIMMFEGECFPGSRRGISNHAEACIPIECTDDAVCGAGATCQTLCTCRAEREFRSNGRIVYAEPRHEVVEIGLCDAQGACAEGDVSERRQCEPTADTAAFDRASHRWTGRPHAVVEPTAEEAPDDGEDDHPPGETSPAGGSCAGCAVPVGAPSGLGVLLAVGAFGVWLTRRRG